MYVLICVIILLISSNFIILVYVDSAGNAGGMDMSALAGMMGGKERVRWEEGMRERERKCFNDCTLIYTLYILSEQNIVTLLIF